MQDFTIEITDLSQITPCAQNPRCNDAAVAVVVELMRQFGVQQAMGGFYWKKGSGSWSIRDYLALS